MPFEPERKCGFRFVGGLYICGEKGMVLPCDWLPKPNEECDVCGNIIKFSRGIQKINPLALWGVHRQVECKCPPTCPLCNPEKYKDFPHYFMWVGAEYTAGTFIQEVRKMGASKKISQMPLDLVIGKSWVYLGKQNYIPEETGFHPEKKKVKLRDAVFYAFRVTSVEYLMEKKDTYTEEEKETIQRCKDRGITIIWIERTPENAIHFKSKGAGARLPKAKKAELEGQQILTDFYES